MIEGKDTRFFLNEEELLKEVIKLSDENYQLEESKIVWKTIALFELFLLLSNAFVIIFKIL